MVAFDLETTSPQPEDARIVAAAVLGVGGGQANESRGWIVDPGVEIPDEAAAIHGITTERARAEGRPAEYAIAEILAELNLSVGPLVAFNASYDLTVLDREARRYGYVPFVPRHVIDPFVIDKALDPYRKGSRKLVNVCRHYGVELEDAHAADADALAAARLAYRLGSGMAGSMTLDALHQAQIRWRREDVASLEAYDRRKGIAPRDYRPEWPLVPFRG